MFVAAAVQSIEAPDAARRQRDLARTVMRTRFRCEGMSAVVDSINALVQHAYPPWFGDVFDRTLGFSPA